jgi:prepilin-type N-terminal cleavage/methylation domain-containing protein
MAFTMIELMVAVVIIGMVAGLLLPALAGTQGDVRLAKCGSNHHVFGLGFHAYAMDHNDFYPVYEDWSAWGGTTGQMTLHGGHVPMSRRPLNSYVAEVETFHCPSDKGDPLWKSQFPKGVQSCFEAWGNSYLVVWAVETMRVKHVTGQSDVPNNIPQARPMKESEIALHAANKLIEGDWVWWADRDKNDPWGQWHNFKGQYRMSVLFGDGHADFFQFPLSTCQWNYTGPAPDPSFTWW